MLAKYELYLEYTELHSVPSAPVEDTVESSITDLEKRTNEAENEF